MVLTGKRLVSLLASDPVSGLALHHPITDPIEGFEVMGMAKIRASMLACGSPQEVVDRFCYAVLVFDAARYTLAAQWSAATALRMLRATPAEASPCTVIRAEG